MVMEILYINEHRSCIDYKDAAAIGFRHSLHAPGEEVSLQPDLCNHLVFFLKGKCVVDCGAFQGRLFEEGEMALLPVGHDYAVRAAGTLEILDLSFIDFNTRCNRGLMDDLGGIADSVEYDFRPTPVRYPLSEAVRMIAECLDAGLNCVHFHILKAQEVFLYLRAFYTGEEVAHLLQPLLNRDNRFIRLVCAGVREGASVEEIAHRAGMSRSTFQKAFKSAFGVTAGTWMRRYLCRSIVRRILEQDAGNISVKDLAYDFNFSSPASFSRFCVANFNCTPAQLIRKTGREEKDGFQVVNVQTFSLTSSITLRSNSFKYTLVVLSEVCPRHSLITATGVPMALAREAQL